MDFWAAVHVVFRRWYMSAPLLLLTVGAAGVVALVAQQYQSTATLLLTSPPITVAPGSGSATIGPNPGQNPFNNFGGSVDTTARILVQIFSTDVKAQNIKAAGAPGTFQVGASTDTGPIITVTASAKNRADAETTAGLVTAAVQDELVSQQRIAGAPEATWIRAQALTAPSAAKRQYGSIVRAAGAVGALGFIITLAATFLVDSLLVQRRQRERWGTTRSYAVREDPAEAFGGRPLGEPVGSRGLGTEQGAFSRGDGIRR